MGWGRAATEPAAMAARKSLTIAEDIIIEMIAGVE
jgi:hypothetical protein